MDYESWTDKLLENMKTTIQYTILIFLFGMMMLACKSNENAEPIAPTTADQVVGSN